MLFNSNRRARADAAIAPSADRRGRTNTLARTLAAASVAFVLSACGGDGGTSVAPAADTLDGVAAVGFPIVGGSIHVSCAGGSALASTITSSTGAWQVSLAGQTLPCAVQVSNGTINNLANSMAYHAIAISAGTVNVTPLSDLLIANLAGSTAPATWFSRLTPAALAAINQAGVNASLTQLRLALPSLIPLSTINPITTVFTPVPGNKVDDMLAALQTALTHASISYATLLANAAQSTFSAPGGYAAALSAAYAGTISGGAFTIPAVPAGVGATAAGSTQINVSWSPVAGASAYNIYRSMSASVQTVDGNRIATATLSPYAHTGLSASGTYYYQVTAANAAGESIGSAEVSATTAAAAAAPPALASFTPGTGAPGASVTLTGSNFSSTAVNNTVSFNGVPATVSNATATQLTVMVPPTASSGNITVLVNGQTATSSAGFTVSAAGGGSGTVIPAALLAISSGGKHTCALNTAGAAYCWGENGLGDLGDGTTTVRRSPVAVLGGLTFSSISAEHDLSCAITTAGALYCWGSGALFGPATSPTAAAPGITFASISTNSNHMCGVATDGTGYCTGFNTFGMLGSGQSQAALPRSATFLPLAGGLRWKQIETSTNGTCGITSAGALHCWGEIGPLTGGADAASWSHTPVLITNAVAFDSLSPSMNQTTVCGLLAGGEAYCVGSGLAEFGGTAGATPLTPVRVGGTNTFKSLAHFGDNLCAVASSNALYCWGNNGRGQLGQGSAPGQSTTPLAVLAGTSFSAVSIGAEDSVCAVTAAGVGYCWGYNFYGQIGDGTVLSRNTPAAILGGITFRVP